MQISNNFNSPLISGGNNRPSTVNKNSLRSDDAVTKVSQEQQSTKQNNSAIIVDEKAIEQFEQNQASLLAKSSQNKDNFSFDYASHDKPIAKNESAVASYQSVGNLAQRESVQQMFGVDLFA